ncbi:MAG: hypothetical protein ABSH48_19760 [Verrucomicrobiota bacterium]
MVRGPWSVVIRHSLFVTLFARAAHGQDALFNSLSLDQSTAARVAQLTTQPHWGPVQFIAGAYAGSSYNDNINGAEYNREADEISRAGVSLNCAWAATDQSQLQFGTGIGYLDYQKYSANSGLQVTPDSALTYAVSLDEVVFTLFDQFSYSREVQSEAALANVVTLPQLNNNGGVRAEWDPDQWVLLASYSQGDYVSDHANDFLNRSSEDLFARTGWRFAEATQLGVEASDSFADYQVVTQNNNQNLSFGGYLEWQVRPSLHLTLRGGPLFYEPDSAGQTKANSSVNSYYASVEITHQITDFLSQSLNLNRSLQAGLNQGGSYLEQTTIGYLVSWSLTQRISVSASANYVDGQQPLAVSNGVYSPFALSEGTENYQQYGGGLQMTWRCTDHFSASVNYNHLQRTSNLAGRSYTDNTVGLQFNYTF